MVLDTGDALVGDGKLGDKTRGAVIVEGMSVMGYDAMALGPNELSLGLDVLKQRMGEATFPMLSANVVVTGTQQLLSRPYVILERAGQRLGVIGLTRQPRLPFREVRVLDPQQAAARYVPEVARQAGTVILLTNLDDGAAQALAQAVPGIDLVIAALPAEPPAAAVRVPATQALLVVAAQSSPSHAGRAIGRLAVTLGADGTLTGEKWRSVWLDKTIADDPKMAELLARY